MILNKQKENFETVNETVLVHDVDIMNKNVIATAAINTLVDPQFGVLWDDDKTYNAIKQYLTNTITYNVNNLHLVIFISSSGVASKLGNSDEINHITASGNIKNVTIEVINVATNITTDEHLIGRVPNDLKFLLSYQYFKAHVDEINHAFIIDLDVNIHRNPFEYVANVDKATEKYNLYTQTEILNAGAFNWLSGYYNNCNIDQPMHGNNDYFYNCGIMGGNLKHLFLGFLKQFSTLMINAPKGAMCDMSILNYLAHYKYNDLAITGYPLH
eukprot:Pgem_evm1s19264